MSDSEQTRAPSDYSLPVSAQELERVAENLRARNIETTVVENGAQAREAVLARVPAGAQVHSAKSKTLQDAGIFDIINDPDKYDALRPRYLKLDRKTQRQEIRKLIAAPDYIVGSVQAVTQDGLLVIVSASSSQLGPYANTAGKVILVVGSQKIVPDLDAAMRRIREYALPWESEQLQKALGIDSFVGKILIIEREAVPDRVTVILVREPIGV